MNVKVVCALVAAIVLILGSVGQAEPTTIMDATLHNGAFTADAAGYWSSNPASIPAGWTETTSLTGPSLYTAALRFLITGSYGEASNNTGELVQANYVYTVSADLGGGAGYDATVRVFATQNADGTGTKVELARVNRLGQATDGYTLFTVVGTPGAPTTSNLTGYYVQVVVGGYIDHVLGGYYDNIVVTCEPSPIKTYMSAALHNGSFSGVSTGYWYNNPPSVPAGWVQVTPYPYTTAYGFILLGTYGEALNNTGELVPAGQAFTVSASLGGGAGYDATVRVFATKNADGTGNKVELARVNRLGQSTDGYTLFNVVGTPGATVPASLNGYYVQVWIGGPKVDHYIGGYYDNIVVTSQEGPPVTTAIYMDTYVHNGALSSTETQGYWADDAVYQATEWSATDPNRVWQAAFAIIFDSPAGVITNNTGEIVPEGHQFTIKANLGGVTGVVANASVYATENIDGTGAKVLLAQVSRPGNDANGYNLFTMTGTGSPAAPSLAGYFVQVSLETVGDIDLNAFYDNILVTSEAAEGPVCGDATHPYPTGDLNQDCYVNLMDVEVFVGQWLASGCVTPNWCDGADLSHDANVKFNDFATLAAHWLECTEPAAPCSFNP